MKLALPLIVTIIACSIAPAQAALVVGGSQFNAGNVGPSPITAVAGDLLETSVASVTGENAAALVRNGTTGTSAEVSGTNPAAIWGVVTTTYNLDVSTNTLGYDIDEVRVFSGWVDGRAGQSYQLWYSLIGSATFTQLGTVSDLSVNGSLLTRTYDTTAISILTQVDAIRFVQVSSGFVGVNTVFREFDVIGVASVPTPAALPAGLTMLGLISVSMRRRHHA